MANTDFDTLQSRLREHVDQVRTTGQPLIITHHGQPDVVLLSPEAYDRLLALARQATGAEAADLVAGAEDAMEGRMRPASEVFEDIARDQGLKAGRER